MQISFIGDLTADIYPKLKKIQLGGASLTSAIWAKRLGAEVTILAAVGNDETGKAYQEFFKKNHLSRTFLTFLTFPTSQIEIFLDQKGERHFRQWQPGAYANYHLGPKEKAFLKTQDAIVLPVYFKTRHLLEELMTNHQRPLIVIDFGDLSQFGKKTDIIEKHLSSIDIVKVGLDIDKDKSLIEKLRKILVRWNLDQHQGSTFNKKLFLITLGPNGSLVFAGGKIFHQ
ncbi:hypothetical protein HY030_02980, partial [Candidatus Gottesmanbacteria bacterium]|nr:hypothetical protein [Candidatus Gottesmanbacteria bacterium]